MRRGQRWERNDDQQRGHSTPQPQDGHFFLPRASILPIETIRANLSAKKNIHFNYLLSSNPKLLYSLPTMLELSF
jgi:hypothetical protein